MADQVAPDLSVFCWSVGDAVMKHQLVKAHEWIIQWVGLRETLQENTIFNGKIYGFL